MAYCNNCGKYVEDDVKFCGYCGAKMAANTSPKSTTSPTQTSESADEQPTPKRKSKKLNKDQDESESARMSKFNLNCPHCGAPLSVDNGLDSFFCLHCGGKILLEGQDKNVISAKVKLKELEHKENLKDKEYEHERFKEEEKTKREKAERKNDNRIALVCLAVVAVCLAIPFIMIKHYEKQDEKINNQLIAIEEKLEIAMENKDYEMALFYANQLQSDADSNESREMWDKKREGYLEMINEKQKQQRLNDPNNIFVPASSDYYAGKDYNEVVEQLKNAGFTNITTQTASEKASWTHPKDTVEHILIGGKSTFTNEDLFDKDTPIIIYYYSK